MDERTQRVSDLLHEASEVHDVFYRITDGADDDWASFYADWLIDHSELPDTLGRAPTRRHLVHELVESKRAFAETAPATTRWQDFYAERIIGRLAQTGNTTSARPTTRQILRRFGSAVLGAFGKSVRWYVKSDVWPWVFALLALGADFYVFTKFIQAEPNPPEEPGLPLGHLAHPSPPVLPAFPLVWVVFAGVGLVAIYILVAFAADDWRIKAYHFVLIVVWLVLSFSWIYFQQGNQRLGFDLYPNFGYQLSKNDALYFTVGTLSTAGTGDLKPKTRNARTAVMVQMSLDVVVLVIGVAGLVRRPRPRNEVPAEGEGPAGAPPPS